MKGTRTPISLDELAKRSLLHDELVAVLADILGNVDYIAGCCAIDAPVAAALPYDVLERAVDVLKRAR